MIATFFVIFYVYCTWTTFAFEAERYRTSMQDEKQLPQELSTCHEVILVQSAAIKDLAKSETSSSMTSKNRTSLTRNCLKGIVARSSSIPTKGYLSSPKTKSCKPLLMQPSVKPRKNSKRSRTPAPSERKMPSLGRTLSPLTCDAKKSLLR